jgi:hypothetical protein
VATAASVAATVAAAAAADPSLPPALAPGPGPGRPARPQRRIQLTLVSGPGFVAPPPSGPSRGASGRASSVSGCGSGASCRSSAVSGRGSGVPSRGAVPTRARGWRGARARPGKSFGPFSCLFNV